MVPQLSDEQVIFQGYVFPQNLIMIEVQIVSTLHKSIVYVKFLKNEPQLEISNDVVCASSKALYQTALNIDQSLC